MGDVEAAALGGSAVGAGAIGVCVGTLVEEIRRTVGVGSGAAGEGWLGAQAVIIHTPTSTYRYSRKVANRAITEQYVPSFGEAKPQRYIYFSGGIAGFAGHTTRNG